ncbi:MAG: Bacterial rane protein YfhO, partial [Acidimicrobiaceae bacterium]|nr:Bacterial rane protein YfhO [Acidimicrobiaceae bacterium]
MAGLPLLPVIGTCVASLVLFRRELVPTPYLNDSAVHEEMVRFALAKIRAGHVPLDSWFPFLNLGSPQYLHYQSLGAMLTALLAWAIGVGHAFTLTTWLLVCCWPLCVYGAARLFGMGRGAAAAAAMLSPFVSSATRVGFEQFSYLWAGYGLWSQLWAMWTLPFAWALSWRAVEERRFVIPAAVLVAATAGFHFETGYLAFAGVAIFVLARPTELLRRAGHACLVAGGAAALSAWAIVPLVAQGHWAAVNQFLQSGPEGVDANSYGARRVLTWLVDGGLLDWHHFLLLTPLCLFGLALSLSCRHRPDGRGSIGDGALRALALLFVSSLVLYFGRPTLGPLLDVLPGSANLFLRRFVVGVQLAGLLLAGAGAARLVSWMLAGAEWILSTLGKAERRPWVLLGPVGVGCLGVLVLVPAWSFVVGQAHPDSSFISKQSSTSAATAQIDSLLATIRREGGGRTFAGDPTDWGAHFVVGEVPVFKYLASKDIDEVGFTLRTASLMSDPEVELDEGNPADYAAFGVRWLILPSAMSPEVPAEAVQRRGNYALWEIPGYGYVQVVDSRGSVTATSGDLGSFSAAFLAGLPSTDPLYPTVAYGGGAPARGTLPSGEDPSRPPGRVLSQQSDLAEGTASAEVSVERTAVVLLSASYDPGWQATVDGRRVATEMVAPALVGVRVGPGLRTVRFVYRGFPDYPQLLLLGA